MTDDSPPSTSAGRAPGDGGGGADSEPSYIDYEAFLSPSFSAASFANTLVLATNNPGDTPLDLATPLSRVLFDTQEIDSHVDSLTTRSAPALVSHTRDQTDAGKRILAELDGQVSALNDGYRRLQREVVHRHAEADEVRAVAARAWHALRLGRDVGRCLQLGRQLEMQFAELSGAPVGTTTTSAAAGAAAARKGDPRALTRCAHTILQLREMLDASLAPPPSMPLASPPNTNQQSGTPPPQSTAALLSRVTVIRTLQSGIVHPIERQVREAAEAAMVRDFNVSGATTTFSAAEDAKDKVREACAALYLLSPIPTTSVPHIATAGRSGGAATTASLVANPAAFEPTLLLHALEQFLRGQLTASVAAVSRGLAAVPTLDRALHDTSLRCQNVVALEAVLEAVRPPDHPLLAALHLRAGGQQAKAAAAHSRPEPSSAAPPSSKADSLLQPLLAHLETSSLASWFWRSLASSLSTRTAELASRGGAAARALRAAAAAVGSTATTGAGPVGGLTLADAVRECVVRGCALPGSMGGGEKVGAGRAGKDLAGAAERATQQQQQGRWEREVAVMVGSVVGNLGR